MKAEQVPQALSDAFEAELVEVTRQFLAELRGCALVLADVRGAIEAKGAVVELDPDRTGHPKFEVAGPAADGRSLCVICSFEETGAVLLLAVYEGCGP